MPIYEYQCSACDHAFEMIQKFSDDPLTQCPDCNANTVIKLVSAAGFQLKGTGWYATDFKEKGTAKKTNAKEPSSEQAGGAEKKPDAPVQKTSQGSERIEK